jgi:hypothetical protein
MPVEVELNGLLPGRGPGLGPAPGRGPGVGPPGWLGRAEPGVGPGRPCPVPARPPGLGTARGPGVWPPGPGAVWAPGPGGVWTPGPGRVWPPGPGTGPRSRSAGWPVVGSGWLNGTCGTPEPTERPPSASGAGVTGSAGLTGVSAAGSATDRACSAAVGASIVVSALATGATGAAGAGAATAGPGDTAAAWPLEACRLPGCPPEVLAFAASPANASLSLRTTGASIVDEADRTNSPISPSLAITALLSTPNSLASSYTRTFATTLPASARSIRASQPDRSSACSVRR